MSGKQNWMRAGLRQHLLGFLQTNHVQIVSVCFDVFVWTRRPLAVCTTREHQRQEMHKPRRDVYFPPSVASTRMAIRGESPL